MVRLWVINALFSSERRERASVTSLTRTPGPQTAWIYIRLATMFGVDAGEVQMSEFTTEEHLGTKALLKI